MKLEGAGKLVLDFVPQAPDAELLMLGTDVVQEDDPSLFDFREPGAEVVAGGVVGVKSVDVKQADGFIGKLRQRVIKAHPQQIQKLTIKTLIIDSHVLVNFFSIVPDVLVALPMVDNIT